MSLRSERATITLDALSRINTTIWPLRPACLIKSMEHMQPLSSQSRIQECFEHWNSRRSGGHTPFFGMRGCPRSLRDRTRTTRHRWQDASAPNTSMRRGQRDSNVQGGLRAYSIVLLVQRTHVVGSRNFHPKKEIWGGDKSFEENGVRSGVSPQIAPQKEIYR